MGNNRENKDGFVLYKSMFGAISWLSNEKLGELTRAIFEWQISDGESCDVESPEVKTALQFFVNQFNIDNDRYRQTCESKRNSVNKRWERKKSIQNDTNDTNVCTCMESIQNDTNDTDKDKDIISPDGDKKEITPKGVPKKKTELSLPYTSPEFVNTWDILRQQPKWKKKTASALQMSLNKLGKYPEKFAVLLMENAIAGGYQGVEFSDTAQKFRQWEKEDSGTTGIREPVRYTKIEQIENY